jgi:TRAP-type C4-dicarboxylate transport system permease small subunit
MKRFYDKLCKAEVFVAAMCFCASCLVIFVSAIARSFHRPLNWSLDISLFLFAWSVFLAADVALRKDKLVNVNILVTRLPARVQTVIAAGVYVAILAFLAALVGYGLYLSYFTRSRAFQGLPKVSYTWVTLAVPVGGVLQIVTVVIKLRNMLRRPAGGS